MITSNLYASYHYAHDAVKESFITKNTSKVSETIHKLIEGIGKDNKGSL